MTKQFPCSRIKRHLQNITRKRTRIGAKASIYLAAALEYLAAEAAELADNAAKNLSGVEGSLIQHQLCSRRSSHLRISRTSIPSLYLAAIEHVHLWSVTRLLAPFPLPVVHRGYPTINMARITSDTSPGRPRRNHRRLPRHNHLDEPHNAAEARARLDIHEP